MDKINIRPSVNMLATLRHINYQPWFAIAEYVDNALQSMLAHREALEQQEGDGYKLDVSIKVDSNQSRMSIHDNAAGIAGGEIERAFRPAALPPDRSGLSEFGMGMKSASFWFAPRWSVRTSALGEAGEREIKLDVEKITENNIEEVAVTQNLLKGPEAHYTEIVLEDVFRLPTRRTVSKIKDHLSDIYRCFTRSGDLQLSFNDEVLFYREPEILIAPHYNDEGGPLRKWRKEIQIDLGNGKSVSGFAALLKTGNTKRAGFALFRRRRLIQGSGEQTYRPQYIFGSSTTFVYQRLFGELHLEGFDVTHTKDGFQWGEEEDAFWELLNEQLDSEDLPLLKQAKEYRKGSRNKKEEAEAVRDAVSDTATVIGKRLPDALDKLSDKPAVETPRQPSEPMGAFSETVRINFRGTDWKINIEVHDDPAESQWLALHDTQDDVDESQARVLGIRISREHPFMLRYSQKDPEDLKALVRIAAAIAIAEAIAIGVGIQRAATIRRNVNELLRDAFSKS